MSWRCVLILAITSTLSWQTKGTSTFKNIFLLLYEFLSLEIRMPQFHKKHILSVRMGTTYLAETKNFLLKVL